MELHPLTPPQDPNATNGIATLGDTTPAATAAPQSGATHIDIGSILLPKKETPGQTPASAQRINAGVLLEQEQGATLQDSAPQSNPATPAPVATPTQAPTPPQEETVVKSLETYRGDIESLIKDKNISVLSIATAEAERRGSHQGDAEPIGNKLAFSLVSLAKTAGLYALGFVMLVGASGALAYIIERPTTVGIPPPPPSSPFIAVDDTRDITISSDTSRDSLMTSLAAAKQATALSLGLMSRLLVTVASDTPTGSVLNAIDAQSFFTLTAQHMPPALLRTIRPAYLLGVHVYKNNEPFLILSVDSYEQAYAEMLAWEPFMQQDLAPLFNTKAPIHIPEEGIASTSPSPQLIQTGFVDSVVENHDARVIQNSTHDISLLWTFIDRNTLVITTNDATVREIISRLKQAPITPQGGQ